MSTKWSGGLVVVVKRLREFAGSPLTAGNDMANSDGCHAQHLACLGERDKQLMGGEWADSHL